MYVPSIPASVPMNRWRYSKSDLANWHGAGLGNRLAQLALMDSESGVGEAPGSSRDAGPGIPVTYSVPPAEGALQSLPDFETAVQLVSRGGGSIGVTTGGGGKYRAPHARGVRDVPAHSTGKNDRTHRGLPVKSDLLDDVRGGHADGLPAGGDVLHAGGSHHAVGRPVGGDFLDARGSLHQHGRSVGSDLIDTLGSLDRDLLDALGRNQYVRSTRAAYGRESLCDVLVPPPDRAAVWKEYFGDDDGILKRNAGTLSADGRVLALKNKSVADCENAVLEKSSFSGNGASPGSILCKTSPVPAYLHGEGVGLCKTSPVPAYLHGEGVGRKTSLEPKSLPGGSPVNVDTTASKVAAVAANAAVNSQPGDVMRDYLGERGLLLPWSGRKTPVPVLQNSPPSFGSSTASVAAGARVHSPGSQAPNSKLTMPSHYQMRGEAAPLHDTDPVTKGIFQGASANGGSVSSAKAASSRSILAAEGHLPGVVANGGSMSHSRFAGHLPGVIANGGSMSHSSAEGHLPGVVANGGSMSQSRFAGHLPGVVANGGSMSHSRLAEQLHGASADSGWSSSAAALQNILTNGNFHGASACGGSQSSAASFKNLLATGLLLGANANGSTLPHATTKFAPSSSSLDSSHPGSLNAASYLMDNSGLDSSYPHCLYGGSYLTANDGGAPSLDSSHGESMYYGSMANEMDGVGVEPSFQSLNPADGHRYRPKLTGNIGTRDRRHRRQRSKNRFGTSGMFEYGQGRLVIARGAKSISILANDRHPIAAEREPVPPTSTLQDAGSNSVTANTDSADWALLNSSPYQQWDWASQNAFLAASVQQTMQVAVHQAMQLHAMQHAMQETGLLPVGQFKSQMCNAWLGTGLCPLMGFCEFAHGAHELQSVLPNWVSQLGMCKQGQLKTEICNNWKETGSCPYGGSCRFAHGLHELRIVLRHPRYKTIPCRMIVNGVNCIYGDRCHFRHQLTNSELSVISIIDLHLPFALRYRNIRGFFY